MRVGLIVVLLVSAGRAFAEDKTMVSETCEATYAALFSKPELNIRVVFGYKDTRPGRFVGDRHERLAFVERILKPCQEAGACGFTRDSENMDFFTKTSVGPQGRMVRIQLSVVNSSVGSDDDENRLDPYQAWRTRYARDAFFGGLQKADVVFYNGHSRFGGGPDFEPPRVGEGGVVDEAYYQGQRPGFSRAIDVLRESGLGTTDKRGDATSSVKPPRLKLLGLFSCSSSQHFSEEIREFSDVGLISSRSLMYVSDALENSLRALSAFLQKKCVRDFREAIHFGEPYKGMRIQGFFKKPKKTTRSMKSESSGGHAKAN